MTSSSDAAVLTDIGKLLNPRTNRDVRSKTLILISTLNSDDLLPILRHDDFAVVKILLSWLNEAAPNETRTIFRIFVNATSACGTTSQILTTEKGFLAKLFSYILDEKSTERTPAAMLLSNLTVDENSCRKLIEEVKEDLLAEKINLINGLRKLCSFLTTVKIRKDNSAQNSKEEDEKDGDEKNDFRLYVSYILRNLTQVAEVRKIFLTEPLQAGGTSETKIDNSNIMLTSIFPIISSACFESNGALREAAVDILRNCCFETDFHHILYTMEHDLFLVTLLNPLVGGEQLTDDENDVLPVDLQYMDSEKQREPRLAIRLKILEALYQLCATSEMREYFRNKGVYYVLREYHKWEKESEEADVICSNVIGVLIRTEDEIGCSNLKELSENAGSETESQK